MRLAAAGLAAAAVSAAASDAAPTRLACLGKPVTIAGTNGRDVLRGTEGPDVIAGRAGDDLILAGGGVDRICGGAGHDRADGGPGSDRIDGGPGQADAVTYSSATRGVVVDLGGGRAAGAGNDRLLRIEWVHGSRFADRLRGGPQANVVDGGHGDDVLVFGASGSDRWVGGPGRDLLTAAGVDAELRADLAEGSIYKPFGIDSIQGIEDLEGGPRRDGLTGDDGPNRLIGGPESDTLAGGGGNDVLLGGNESDALLPGPGSDYVDGQEGWDSVAYYGEVGVEISLATGRAVYMGALDMIHSVRGVTGSSGNDRIEGDDGDNQLIGLNGHDEIYGLAGNDYLQGGAVLNVGKFTHLDGGPDRDDCRTARTYVNCEYVEP